MSIYSTRKSKTKKHGPSGAQGPAGASPCRAKRGTLPKLSTFLSQLKGDPLEKKQIFKKMSHNAEKKADPLGFLTTQSVVKYQIFERHYSAQASYFAAFRGIRDTKIEKSRGIQDKISL